MVRTTIILIVLHLGLKTIGQSGYDSMNDKSKKNNFQSFTKEQIDFLVNEFTRELKNLPDDTNVNVSIGETISLWNEGEKEYGPGIEFNSFFNPEFSGDFERDNSNEIFFVVNKTGGGTAVWQVIYCLKTNKHSLRLTQLNISCPCSNPFKCQDSPHPELTNINNDTLVIKTGCLNDKDAECCPSIYYEVTYKYGNDSLIELNKEKLE